MFLIIIIIIIIIIILFNLLTLTFCRKVHQRLKEIIHDCILVGYSDCIHWEWKPDTGRNLRTITHKERKENATIVIFFKW